MAPILLGVPSTFRMGRDFARIQVGMLKCLITVGEMKLSVAPLSIRASTSEIKDRDRRLTGMWTDRLFERNVACGNTALSMAKYCGLSKNVFPIRSSLGPIARVVLGRVGSFGPLGLGRHHLRLLQFLLPLQLPLSGRYAHVGCRRVSLVYWSS